MNTTAENINTLRDAATKRIEYLQRHRDLSESTLRILDEIKRDVRDLADIAHLEAQT